MTDPGDLSSIQKDLVPLAFQKFVSANSMTGCMAGTVKPVSYNVTKACEQVCLLIQHMLLILVDPLNAAACR